MRLFESHSLNSGLSVFGAVPYNISIHHADGATLRVVFSGLDLAANGGAIADYADKMNTGRIIILIPVRIATSA
jgi:hypothetical protein